MCNIMCGNLLMLNKDELLGKQFHSISGKHLFP